MAQLRLVRCSQTANDLLDLALARFGRISHDLPRQLAICKALEHSVRIRHSSAADSTFGVRCLSARHTIKSHGSCRSRAVTLLSLRHLRCWDQRFVARHRRNDSIFHLSTISVIATPTSNQSLEPTAGRREVPRLIL